MAGWRSLETRGGGGRVAAGLTVVLVSPAVTAVSGLIMVLLFFSELQYYLTKEVSTADGADTAPVPRCCLRLAPGSPSGWPERPCPCPRRAAPLGCPGSSFAPHRPAVRVIFLCPVRSPRRWGRAALPSLWRPAGTAVRHGACEQPCHAKKRKQALKPCSLPTFRDPTVI